MPASRSARCRQYAVRCTLLALCTLYALQAQPLDRAKIDTAVHKAMHDWGVPGAAVAIVRGDDVLVAQGYGVKELGHTDPVTANTLFAIGSTTKAFTTAAMAMLVDDGKMNWDDPVRKYIDFFHLSDPLADQMVTLRDLVCHRTGLSRNDLLWYSSPWSSEEIIHKIAFIKPTRPFRSAWQYNNLMFLTAGYAVGKAAGMPWQDFIQKRIFDPLDMATADTTTTVAEKSPDHASPHRKPSATASNGEAAKTSVISWYNLDSIQPAGAINASAQDLAKWVRFQLSDGTIHGKRLISARNMAEMHTAQMVMRPEDWGREFNPETHQMSYGLAWMIHDYRGIHLVSHGGAIDGFRANITMVPDRKIGIVVLSNLDQENMPEALRYSLLDIVLGLPERDWDAVLMEHFASASKREAAAAKKFLDSRVPDTKPSRELALYAGEYIEPAYGTATVTVENDTLAIAWSNFHQPLDHFHFDTFRVRGGRIADTPVQFRLAANGAVDSMSFVGVEFRRKSR
jgi:CubicO group peptidase (beta-lactamase class C family)